MEGSGLFGNLLLAESLAVSCGLCSLWMHAPAPPQALHENPSTLLARVLGWGGQDRLSGPRLPSFPCCTPINDLYGFLSQRWLPRILVPPPGPTGQSAPHCPYPET